MAVVVNVYVISLPHRTDRRDRIVSKWPHATIIDAVDGRTLQPHPTLTKGEIGCFVSHIGALKLFRSDSADYGLILEDDCTLTPQTFFSSMPTIVERAPRGWGAISLGCNYIPPSARQVSHRLMTLGPTAGLYGAHAILYNREGARAYLKAAKTIEEPWDLWIAKCHTARPLYVCNPPLAFVRDFGDTDTQRIR